MNRLHRTFPVAMLVLLLGHVSIAQEASPVTPERPKVSFREALETGNVDAVIAYLDRGRLVNRPIGGDHETPLMVAVKAHQAGMAGFLLDHGAKADATDAVLDTALHWAAHGGLVDIVKRLLNEGADLNAANAEGRTPLHFATEGRQVEAIKVFVRRHARLDAQDVNGLAPLDVALAQRRPAMSAWLVALGVPVISPESKAEERVLKATENRRNFVVIAALKEAREAGLETLAQSLGQSALRVAFRSGQYPLAVQLLGEGRIGFASMASTLNPLAAAVESGSLELVQALLDVGADPNEPIELSRWTPLHVAAVNGFAPIATALLDRSADPDARDGRGRTPLHVATISNQFAIVELLLERGASMDVQDFDGNTLLHFAASTGRADMVRAALGAGVRRDLRDAEDRTPYDIATALGNAELARMLAPADPSKRERPPFFDELVEATMLVQSLSHEDAATWVSGQVEDGYRPIHLAVSLKLIDVVEKVLVENPEALHVRAPSGLSPLHMAAETGDLRIVRILIERGASVDEADPVSGWVPLHFAASTGQSDVVDILLDAGARADHADALGHTPAYIADRGGFAKLAKRLDSR